MKLRIEIDETAEEDEVVIRCKALTGTVRRMQQVLTEFAQTPDITFFKDNTEYFPDVNEILFFETSGTIIAAHTADNVFTVKAKLYELERTLPLSFIRVSKSTILNVSHIYSIEKNITASSIVQFSRSHKQVYVSRNYYKVLKQRLDERRKVL